MRSTVPKPSSYWRERAEEARAQLDQMRDPDAVNAMRIVVENYQKLAAITEATEKADTDNDP